MQLNFSAVLIPGIFFSGGGEFSPSKKDLQFAVAKVPSRRYYSCEIKVLSRRHLIKKICGTGKTAL